MQAHVASEDANPIRECLHQESDGLATLHQGWTQHVAAWQLAHQAAVSEAQGLLARMDALIARLESR